MFERVLAEAIGKYLNTVNEKEANAAKVEIERLIDTTTDPSAREQIQEVLAGSGMPTEWLENHFTPGSFFTHRGWVFGWYYPKQLQAERLPVKLSADYFKGIFRKIEVIENRDGFRIAEPLPFIDGLPVEIPQGKTHLFARYGWAAGLLLQWHRTADGLIVDRTILSYGFALAWRWWPAAAKYYAKHPPSPLLEDCRLSSEPDRDSSVSDGWLS